jgi:hypothetical protein
MKIREQAQANTSGHKSLIATEEELAPRQSGNNAYGAPFKTDKEEWMKKPYD